MRTAFKKSSVSFIKQALFKTNKKQIQTAKAKSWTTAKTKTLTIDNSVAAH